MKLEALIFAETTTIGIRRARMERTVLPRRRDMVHTAYGDVAVKRCLLDSGERCYVEYDSAAKLAQEQGAPCSMRWPPFPALAIWCGSF